jgi:hypothetical protein
VPNIQALIEWYITADSRSQGGFPHLFNIPANYYSLLKSQVPDQQSLAVESPSIYQMHTLKGKSYVLLCPRSQESMYRIGPNSAEELELLQLSNANAHSTDQLEGWL